MKDQLTTFSIKSPSWLPGLLAEQLLKSGRLEYTGAFTPAEISDAELQILQKKKNEMEVKKLEAQVSDLTFKQAVAQGKFIPRAEFEMEVAGRAGALDAGLRHRFMSECRDMVDGVAGKPSLVPILQEMLGKMLDEALNEYASLDNFQVIIEG